MRKEGGGELSSGRGGGPADIGVGRRSPGGEGRARGSRNLGGAPAALQTSGPGLRAGEGRETRGGTPPLQPLTTPYNHTPQSDEEKIDII